MTPSEIRTLLQGVIDKTGISVAEWARLAGVNKSTIFRALRPDYDFMTSTRTLNKLMGYAPEDVREEYNALSSGDPEMYRRLTAERKEQKALAENPVEWLLTQTVEDRIGQEAASQTWSEGYEPAAPEHKDAFPRGSFEWLLARARGRQFVIMAYEMLTATIGGFVEQRLDFTAEEATHLFKQDGGTLDLITLVVLARSLGALNFEESQVVYLFEELGEMAVQTADFKLTDQSVIDVVQKMRRLLPAVSKSEPLAVDERSIKAELIGVFVALLTSVGKPRERAWRRATLGKRMRAQAGLDQKSDESDA